MLNCSLEFIKKDNINFLNNSKRFVFEKSSDDNLYYKYKIDKYQATCLILVLIPFAALGGPGIVASATTRFGKNSGNLPVDERHMMLILKYQNCNIPTVNEVQISKFISDKFFPSYQKVIEGDSSFINDNSTHVKIEIQTVPVFIYDNSAFKNTWSLEITTSYKMRNTLSNYYIWKSSCKTNYEIDPIDNIISNSCKPLLKHYESHSDFCFEILNNNLQYFLYSDKDRNGG